MSPEERLDRIESRTAIADIVHACARAVRHGRPIPAEVFPPGFEGGLTVL